MYVNYDRGYQDYKAGMNATGSNDDYDEGWVRAYQESNNIYWTKKSHKNPRSRGKVASEE